VGHAELIAQVVEGPLRATRADKLRALVQVLSTGGWADGTARADDTAAGTAGGTVRLTVSPRLTAAGKRRPVDDVAPRPAGRWPRATRLPGAARSRTSCACTADRPGTSGRRCDTDGRLADRPGPAGRAQGPKPDDGRRARPRRHPADRSRSRSSRLSTDDRRSRRRCDRPSPLVARDTPHTAHLHGTAQPTVHSSDNPSGTPR